MNKHDQHYHDVEVDGFSFIEFAESFMQREEIPVEVCLNLVLAAKHLFRCGKKEGTYWLDDVEKMLNYVHRASTGQWYPDKKPEPIGRD